MKNLTIIILLSVALALGSGCSTYYAGTGDEGSATNPLLLTLEPVAKRGASVNLTADFSVNATIWTVIPWGSINFDDGYEYDAAAGEFTIPSTGLYTVRVLFFVPSDPTLTGVEFQIQNNGGEILHQRYYDLAHPGENSFAGAVTSQFTAGDKVRAAVYFLAVGHPDLTVAYGRTELFSIMEE